MNAIEAKKITKDFELKKQEENRKELIKQEAERLSSLEEGRKFFHKTYKKFLIKQIEDSAFMGLNQIDINFMDTPYDSGTRIAVIEYLNGEGYKTNYKKDVCVWSDPDTGNVYKNILTISW